MLEAKKLEAGSHTKGFDDGLLRARSQGEAYARATVAEPEVHNYGNIECRDAVLAWDAQEPAYDAQGKLLSRWDGVTFKTHPVTGEPVPDDAAQVPQWRYIGARKAAWPQADFLVGNPPFIGNKRMRDADDCRPCGNRRSRCTA